MPFIRINEQKVCEIFYGDSVPVGCEAPGKWERVEKTDERISNFEKLMDSKFEESKKLRELRERAIKSAMANIANEEEKKLLEGMKP